MGGMVTAPAVRSLGCMGQNQNKALRLRLSINRVIIHLLRNLSLPAWAATLSASPRCTAPAPP